MKSVEQRLYESMRLHRGLRLSSAEVQVLCNDDAIRTRISNTAAVEANGDAPGCDCLDDCELTWSELVNSFRNDR